MRELSERWERHYRKTFLGRLRLEIFKEITGAEHAEPDPSGVRLFLMTKRRTQSFLADHYTDLLATSVIDTIDWNELEPPADFRWVLHKLERKASRERIFWEIRGCPPPYPDPLGIVVQTHRSTVDRYVHTLTFFDGNFLEKQSVLGYVEIHPRSATAPKVAVFSRETAIPHADLVALASPLLSLAAANRRYHSLPESFILGMPSLPGPDGACDPHFMELVMGVLVGEVPCHELIVPLERVKPHDPAAALSYPDEFLQQVLPDLQDGLRPHMAVYWDGVRLIMCDDYPVYLAYRLLREERVPVVVLGPYPAEEFGPAQKSGGHELLPDVAIGRTIPANDDENLELQLDARLRRQSGSDGPLMLYAVHARLCELLENPQCTEQEIHRFLAQFPISVDTYGYAVRSEVRLGRAYRVDLLLEYRTLDRRLLLVELEAPTKHLLTRGGRLRAPITHALQQVEDWLRWWVENPLEIPAGIEHGALPDGLVVAGRKQLLTADDQRRLIHLNHNRRVQLLTYDDLLDRLEEMIRSIEAVGSGTPS